MSDIRRKNNKVYFEHKEIIKVNKDNKILPGRIQTKWEYRTFV